MTVQNGQLVNASVTNAAYISKTDTTVINTASGLIGLNNTSESDSGAAITNIQKRMNDNKFLMVGVETVSAATAITALTHGNQYRRVTGDGGPITVSDEPFGTGAFEDGIFIRIVGTSDTQPVTIANKDISKGAVLNGEAQLKKYYILDLQYDSVLDRFIEVGRNF